MSKSKARMIHEGRKARRLWAIGIEQHGAINNYSKLRR